jgi:hypothetical protein
MTDNTTRNAQLLNALVRISPASDTDRFTELCLNFDFEESEVVFFFEPKPGDRLFTVDMECIDLVVFDSQSRASYVGDEIIITDVDNNNVLSDLKLYTVLV